MEESKIKSDLGIAQKIWQKICFVFVISFYRKVEISGSYQLNNKRPVILCANHSNALADAVLLQYSTYRLVHPLARSGLFKNPLLKFILLVWQAVPVYRRQDSDDGIVDNDAMFSKAYEMLAKNEVLMIFPEGQSHSDLHLRQIKTGVSRIILGYKEKYNEYPLVIPVGLNFSHTGKFRSNVYINYGKPLDIDSDLLLSNEADIKNLTNNIMNSMKDVVIEIDKVEDLVFVKQVERFFALRHKNSRKRNLSQKFKSHKLLLSVKKYLHQAVPDQIDSFKRHLRQFNRLCNRLGVNDYNLNVSYNSQVIRGFVIRSLFIIAVMLPIGLLGFVNSFVPYVFTKITTKLLASGKDQYDTTKILAGSVFFSAFWLVQTNLVYSFYGFNIALIYFICLIPCSLTSLVIMREHVQIIDNLRVFIVLIRRRNIRRYLIKKRKNIEMELASLIKVARSIK